jgi:polyketide cyclase/dehydrase/lipid transport protein
MARYLARIESALPQAEAFAYMADFANARLWDPSVSEARRVGEAPIGIGVAFDVVARFGGRDVPLRYEIVEYDRPRRVVLEARRPSFVSRDVITVEPAGSGSIVSYDATLAFGGIGRLLDPVMQRIFDRVGARATLGMQNALNP